MKKRGYKRSERVGQQLHELIARFLLMEIEDPGVSQVQITHVDVTPNLRHARVFYVMLEGKGEDKSVQAALERATGLVKREIGATLNLKYVPSVDFEYDESVERGRRIEDLLSGLNDDQA